MSGESQEPMFQVATEDLGVLFAITPEGRLVWGDGISAEDVGSAAARAFVDVVDLMLVARTAIRDVESMSIEQLATLLEVVRVEMASRSERN